MTQRERRRKTRTEGGTPERRQRKTEVGRHCSKQRGACQEEITDTDTDAKVEIKIEIGTDAATETRRQIRPRGEAKNEIACNRAEPRRDQAQGRTD